MLQVHFLKGNGDWSPLNIPVYRIEVAAFGGQYFNVM